MLFVPLSLAAPFRQRPIAAWVIGAVIFYRSLAVAFIPRGMSMSISDFLGNPAATLDFLWVLFQSAITPGRGPSGILAVMFWVVLGGSLEDRLGVVRVMGYFVLGCAAGMLAGHWPGVMGLSRTYWLGLTGTLFCLGAAYRMVGLMDVKAWYWLGPFGGGETGGTTTVPAGLVLGGLHLLLGFGQLQLLAGRTTPGAMLSPFAWVMLVPFAGFAFNALEDRTLGAMWRKIAGVKVVAED